MLPSSVAASSDRLARFQREAEVLASLSHPNIAMIYGLEGDGAARALVMELVEGPTLAERLAGGPLPVDEALGMARQIAEALEAAHEQGIVHRDLKPANIKVRSDGTVKVLDFGLARAMEPSATPAAASSMAPTITSPAMTQLGMILGTAAYMSPEQARGKPVDRRADIWAFGAVLYEMLTGRRAFDDEDVSLTLAKVLQRDPDYTLLPTAVPPVSSASSRCASARIRDSASDMRDVRLAREGAAFRIRSNGRGGCERTLPDEKREMPVWDRTRTDALLYSVRGDSGLDLWVLPETGERVPYPLAEGAIEAQASLDEQWVAYTGRPEAASGSPGLWVVPLAAPRETTGGRWFVGTGRIPAWRRDGRELFYLSLPEQVLTAVPVTDAGEAPEFGPPEPLFDVRFPPITGG